MPPQVLFFGAFRLDLANERVWRDDAVLALRPKVFAVLRHLVTNPGRLVTREELLRTAWPKTVVSDSVLRGTIRELREALGDDAAAVRFVETVPHRGYRFAAPVATAAAPVETPDPRDDDAAPLVGRVDERARLHAALARTLRGERQVVFVTGEPGIGKTTLVDAFVADVAHAGPGGLVRVARGQCVEHYGPSEPYLPVLDAFGLLCRALGGDRVTAVLRRVAPTWLAQLPAVAGDDERAELRRTAEGATHARMLREMADALEALAEETPLVFVLEDLHWSDPSTLDLVGLLAQRRAPARLLVLATYRPADLLVTRHPLRALKQELDAHRRCDEISLPFLTVADVTSYLAERFAERAVPAELGHLVHRGTEGNPLFMVHVVDEWERDGAAIDRAGDWSAPASLRQLIEKQLERLAPDEQRLLEVASVAGASFTTGALAAVLGESPEIVEARCADLAARHQFLRAAGVDVAADGAVAGRYELLHALHQQVLYDRLSPARRAQLHRQIGAWEERAAGARANAIAAELAMHFERGHDPERAVHWLLHAGRTTLALSAHPEALRLLERGIELLASMPETPTRARYDSALSAALGATLAIAKGCAAPEVRAAYDRAYRSARDLDAPAQDLSVLGGLSSFHFLRADMATASELGATLTRLAASADDRALAACAHTIEGMAASTTGDVSAALRHLERARALHDPSLREQDRVRVGAQDAHLTALAYEAWTLWRAGHPDRARAAVTEVVAVARALAHPFSLAFALDFAGAGPSMLLRDVDAVGAFADELVALAGEHGFPYWLAWGTVRQGWVLAQRRRIEDGIARMRDGLAAIRATGAELSVPYVRAQLAEALAQVQRAEEGLALLDEALAATHATGERWYDAELHRLRGDLTLALAGRGCVEAAAPHFTDAIAIARRQGAKAFELRATVGLARLLRRQRKPAEARAALAAIYEQFGEGRDTADLSEARALLAALTPGAR